MKITLNGEAFSHVDLTTVASLIGVLDELGLAQISGQRCAIMVNGAVIRKEKFAETALNAGDSVEIIQMVGGG